MKEFKLIKIWVILAMVMVGVGVGSNCFAESSVTFTIGEKNSKGDPTFLAIHVNNGSSTTTYTLYLGGDVHVSAIPMPNDPGNPNPEDPNSGTGLTFDELLSILKNHASTNKEAQLTLEQFFVTPLGKKLLQGGTGPIPLWNPSSEIGSEAIDGQAGGSGFFMPNAGSFTDQLKKAGSGGGSGNSDSGGDDPGKKEKSKRGLGTYDSDGILIHPKAQPTQIEAVTP